MKIGIDARLWSETGVGRYIRNLVKELQIIDKKNEYILFVRKSDCDKVNNQISNNKFKTQMADIRWHTLDEQLKLPQILNGENLDLVHFPYFSIPIGYKKPFVITIHDLIINHFPTGKASKLPLYLYQLKKIGYDYVVRKAVSRAKKIIVPLNAVRDDLIITLAVKKEKIFVTYEGFDEKIIKNDKLPQVDSTRYFLYVGNAYPHKNLDKLIKAFSLFRKDGNEDVQLLLVGKDDYFYKKLHEKIRKENYLGVVIRNNVTDAELATFYQNAIALISPSLMEGFGLPVLEAMASSCLVLASSIPSFKEVCGDAGMYFNPYSVGDIKEKMQHAYGLDISTKNKCIKRGLIRAGQFSWRKMAQETLRVYEGSIGIR
ncbi:MAG: glycosyltransferase family 4 protein [Bacteroidota bacterium]|nr:glycosyltransferase family 4 protein [Bacteroidota bacterium]